MRKIYRLMAVLTAFALLCGACATAEESAKDRWYFRVVGRDDTAAGQAEKLRVRDMLLALCPRRAAELTDHLKQIRRAVNRIAPCEVEIRSWSPDEKTPPAPTVYVTAGDGQGHNCWGILYEDSLLLARMDGEDGPVDQPVFVWPLWQRIMRWLGLWPDQAGVSSRMTARISSILDSIS